MSLTDRPLHPHFAAEVTGLDMRVPPDASSMRAIVEAADTHAVLVFPGQHIDDAQHVAFSRPFGRLETTIKAYRPGFKGRLDPHVADISNLDENSELLSPTDRRRMNSLDNRLWHTDYTFKETPGLCSLLTARVIPKDGGETEFTGLRAAYDALPERMKLRLRRRPKIDASIGLQPPLVMVRLDRTIGRGTVPLRMVRSSRTMTWKGRRRDSVVFGRRLRSLIAEHSLLYSRGTPQDSPHFWPHFTGRLVAPLRVDSRCSARRPDYCHTAPGPSATPERDWFRCRGPLFQLIEITG